VEKFYKEEDYRNDKGLFRDETGRFVVDLPLKENVRQLANNRNQAYWQLTASEKKRQKNPREDEEYKKFMNVYESMGHMEEIEVPDEGPVYYYLPHHAIENPESTTTPTRVVFNVSSKTSSGLSFNDVQFIGPQIQS
jgi:hypothetical protein